MFFSIPVRVPGRAYCIYSKQGTGFFRTCLLNKVRKGAGLINQIVRVMKEISFRRIRTAVTVLLFGFLLSFVSGSCSKESGGSDNEQTVAVTGVTLDKSTLSLTVGNTGTLTATVKPSDATNTKITWSSDTKSVATVSDGTVAAVAAGSATITVSTADGSYTATCAVTVTEATSSSSYSQSSGTNTVTGKTYSSTTSDVNAVKVSGGTFTMTNCTVTKTGDTGNSDNSSFYGINAGILSSGSGSVVMSGGTITTNAKGANGIVAYGGTVTVSDVTINCSQNLSRGIHCTGGGTLTATNLTITTAGSNSSVIALDKGGGTVNVTGGSYTCTGTDCAVLYSTGSLTVNGITGSSSTGEIGVIEGDNYITINNSTITSGASSSSRGMMILQSGSGDAGTGTNGVISVKKGSLILTGSGTSLIEIVTNVRGQVTLDSVATTIPSNILMTVDYNTRWSTNGATGVLILKGDKMTYTGNIVTDSYSSAELTVNSGVIWKGAYDNANTGKSTSIAISGGTWTLTGNSYVDTITLTNGATINKDGYTLTYTTLTNTSGTIND
jgi:hypothetical protein